MKRFLSVFSLFFLLLLPSVFAQASKYVLQTKGDTLVVKDDFDYGATDALNQLLIADTLNVPKTRVYELHNNGYYSVITSPTSSKTQASIIMGESNESVKTRKDAAAPPIICGAVYEGGTSTGGINSGYDLLLKNVNTNAGNSAGGEGWAFFGLSGPNERIIVDNCISEHTLWTGINPAANSRIFFRNSYFVNMSGHACRRNGGVIDFFSSQDTICVENCTHVMGQGSMYKTRTGYKVNRFLFNHNNWVNCSGYVFMNRGEITNASVTNNMVINSNVQGYSPILTNADNGETDSGNLPMGIVNILADSAFVANGASFYADDNLIYWDPTFNDYISTLNTKKVNGVTNWVSQMITMNTRTAGYFADKKTYPHLTNGTWIQNKLPKFKNTADLFTTQLTILKTYVLATVDTTSTQTLPDWRLASNPSATYYTYSDWPIPIDLSYTDTDLLVAGLNKFPIGDLNWFPTQYKAWLAQRSTELTQINNVLKGTTGVKKVAGLPENYQLGQNYPNPFNPTTVINYTIPKAGNVTLKVYNLLGQEVASLVNGYQPAAKYQVNFNASKLASGVYLYTIKADNFTQTMKMMLMK